MTVIIDSLGRRWDPRKHPRDRKGRFISVGRLLQLFDFGSSEPWGVGRVDSIDNENKINITVTKVKKDGSAKSKEGAKVALPSSQLLSVNEKGSISLAESRAAGSDSSRNTPRQPYGLEKARQNSKGFGSGPKAFGAHVGFNTRTSAQADKIFKGEADPKKNVEGAYLVGLWANHERNNGRLSNEDFIGIMDDLDVDLAITGESPDGLTGMKKLVDDYNKKNPTAAWKEAVPLTHRRERENGEGLRVGFGARLATNGDTGKKFVETEAFVLTKDDNDDWQSDKFVRDLNDENGPRTVFEAAEGRESSTSRPTQDQTPEAPNRPDTNPQNRDITEPDADGPAADEVPEQIDELGLSENEKDGLDEEEYTLEEVIDEYFPGDGSTSLERDEYLELGDGYTIDAHPADENSWLINDGDGKPIANMSQRTVNADTVRAAIDAHKEDRDIPEAVRNAMVERDRRDRDGESTTPSGDSNEDEDLDTMLDRIDEEVQQSGTDVDTAPDEPVVDEADVDAPEDVPEKETITVAPTFADDWFNNDSWADVADGDDQPEITRKGNRSSVTATPAMLGDLVDRAEYYADMEGEERRDNRNLYDSAKRILARLGDEDKKRYKRAMNDKYAQKRNQRSEENDQNNSSDGSSDTPDPKTPTATQVNFLDENGHPVEGETTTDLPDGLRVVSRTNTQEDGITIDVFDKDGNQVHTEDLTDSWAPYNSETILEGIRKDIDRKSRKTEDESRSRDEFPEGTEVELDISSIGGRKDTVRGKVAGYDGVYVNVDTDSGHGTVSARRSDLRKVDSAVSTDNGEPFANGLTVEEASRKPADVSALDLVRSKTGKTGRATVLSQEDFDNIDAPEIYRGASLEGIDDLYGDDPRMGSGGTGDGLYFTDDKAVARRYGGAVGSNDDRIATAKLSPDARVMTADEVREAMDRMGDPDAPPLEQWAATQGPTVVATALGYDGVHVESSVGEGDYTIITNPKALILRDRGADLPNSGNRNDREAPEIGEPVRQKTDPRGRPEKGAEVAARATIFDSEVEEWIDSDRPVVVNKTNGRKTSQGFLSWDEVNPGEYELIHTTDKGSISRLGISGIRDSDDPDSPIEIVKKNNGAILDINDNEIHEDDDSVLSFDAYPVRPTQSESLFDNPASRKPKNKDQETKSDLPETEPTSIVDSYNGLSVNEKRSFVGNASDEELEELKNHYENKDRDVKDNVSLALVEGEQSRRSRDSVETDSVDSRTEDDTNRVEILPMPDNANASNDRQRAAERVADEDGFDYDSATRTRVRAEDLKEGDHVEYEMYAGNRYKPTRGTVDRVEPDIHEGELEGNLIVLKDGNSRYYPRNRELVRFDQQVDNTEESVDTGTDSVDLPEGDGNGRRPEGEGVRSDTSTEEGLSESDRVDGGRIRDQEEVSRGLDDSGEDRVRPGDELHLTQSDGTERVIAPVAVHQTPENRKRVLEREGKPAPDFYELDPEDSDFFREAMLKLKENNKYSASVHVYDEDEYKNMRLFITDDGKLGFALNGDDIVSAFSHGDTKYKGGVRAAIATAIANGGRRADSFDTVLPEIYAEEGLVAVARTRWNDEFAPEGWDKNTFNKFNNGEPDVVLYAYDPDRVGVPYTRRQGQVFEDWDDAESRVARYLDGDKSLSWENNFDTDFALNPEERRDRIAAGVRSGVRQSEPLSDEGVNGGTELVTFNDGSQAVRKTWLPNEVEEQRVNNRRAEDLIHSLGGLTQAGVEIDGDYYTDPITSGRHLRFGEIDDPDSDFNVNVVKTRSAESVAVSDWLLTNGDRNTGNYFVTPEGNIVAIDNDLANLEDVDSYAASDFSQAVRNNTISDDEIIEAVSNLSNTLDDPEKKNLLNQRLEDLLEVRRRARGEAPQKELDLDLRPVWPIVDLLTDEEYQKGYNNTDDFLRGLSSKYDDELNRRGLNTSESFDVDDPDQLVDLPNDTPEVYRDAEDLLKYYKEMEDAIPSLENGKTLTMEKRDDGSIISKSTVKDLGKSHVRVVHPDGRVEEYEETLPGKKDSEYDPPEPVSKPRRELEDTVEESGPETSTDDGGGSDSGDGDGPAAATGGQDDPDEPAEESQPSNSKGVVDPVTGRTDYENPADDPRYSHTEPEQLEGEKYPPTRQQQDIIDAVMGDLDVTVQALAGTGKTSTLEALARRIGLRKDKENNQIIYIAFNKSVQTEAEKRMPGNVESRTGHSIAFQWSPKWIQQRSMGGGEYGSRGKKSPITKFREIYKHLGISESDKEATQMSQYKIAQTVRETIDTYSNSDDDVILDKHIPGGDMDPSGRAVILRHANAYWKDLNDPEGRMKLTPNHYRKMWALSKPDFSKEGSGVAPASVLFIDEAQDTPPVLAKVVADQKIQKVIVGDSNQAIYSSFTLSHDILGSARTDTALPLTKSYRFGRAIGDIGNRFLQLLRSDKRVIGGNPNDGEIVDKIDEPDAFLSRTNMGMLEAIEEAHSKGKRIGVAPGAQDKLLKLIDSVAHLKREKKMNGPLHEDLDGYSNWEEVKAAADKNEPGVSTIYRMFNDKPAWVLRNVIEDVVDPRNRVDPEDRQALYDNFKLEERGKGKWAIVNVKRNVRLGNTFAQKRHIKNAGFKWDSSNKEWVTDDPNSFDRAIQNIKDFQETDPDISIMTAHTAKGLEWKKVQIGDDFRGPEMDEEGNINMPDPEELRLGYVAVTRAEETLAPGSLSYIFDHTDENGGVVDVDRPDADDLRGRLEEARERLEDKVHSEDVDSSDPSIDLSPDTDPTPDTGVIDTTPEDDDDDTGVPDGVSVDDEGNTIDQTDEFDESTQSDTPPPKPVIEEPELVSPEPVQGEKPEREQIVDSIPQDRFGTIKPTDGRVELFDGYSYEIEIDPDDYDYKNIRVYDSEGNLISDRQYFSGAEGVHFDGVADDIRDAINEHRSRNLERDRNDVVDGPEEVSTTSPDSQIPDSPFDPEPVSTENREETSDGPSTGVDVVEETPESSENPVEDTQRAPETAPSTLTESTELTRDERRQGNRITGSLTDDEWDSYDDLSDEGKNSYVRNRIQGDDHETALSKANGTYERPFGERYPDPSSISDIDELDRQTQALEGEANSPDLSDSDRMERMQKLLQYSRELNNRYKSRNESSDSIDQPNRRPDGGGSNTSIPSTEPEVDTTPATEEDINPPHPSGDKLGSPSSGASRVQEDPTDDFTEAKRQPTTKLIPEDEESLEAIAQQKVQLEATAARGQRVKRSFFEKLMSLGRNPVMTNGLKYYYDDEGEYRFFERGPEARTKLRPGDVVWKEFKDTELTRSGSRDIRIGVVIALPTHSQPVVVMRLHNPDGTPRFRENGKPYIARYHMGEVHKYFGMDDTGNPIYDGREGTVEGATPTTPGTRLPGVDVADVVDQGAPKVEGPFVPDGVTVGEYSDYNRLPDFMKDQIDPPDGNPTPDFDGPDDSDGPNDVGGGTGIPTPPPNPPGGPTPTVAGNQGFTYPQGTYKGSNRFELEDNTIWSLHETSTFPDSESKYDYLNADTEGFTNIRDGSAIFTNVGDDAGRTGIASILYDDGKKEFLFNHSGKVVGTASVEDMKDRDKAIQKLDRFAQFTPPTPTGAFGFREDRVDPSGTPVTKFSDGLRSIEFYGNYSEDEKRFNLDRVQRVLAMSKEMANNADLTIVFEDPDGGPSARGMLGEELTGSLAVTSPTFNKISVGSRVGKSFGDESIGGGLEANKHFMPSYYRRPGGTNGVDYILLHEFGHVVDFINGKNTLDSSPESRAFFMKHRKNSSQYGRTSPHEAYAEAYAQWILGGPGSSDTSDAYAKEYGWEIPPSTNINLIDIPENPAPMPSI